MGGKIKQLTPLIPIAWQRAWPKKHTVGETLKRHRSIQIFAGDPYISGSVLEAHTIELDKSLAPILTEVLSLSNQIFQGPTRRNPT